LFAVAPGFEFRSDRFSRQNFTRRLRRRFLSATIRRMEKNRLEAFVGGVIAWQKRPSEIIPIVPKQSCRAQNESVVFPHESTRSQRI
jgi:hypothetical protein